MVKKQGHLSAEIIIYHLLSDTKLISEQDYLKAQVAMARDCAGRAEEFGERILSKLEDNVAWPAKLAYIYAVGAKNIERRKLWKYCAEMPFCNPMVAKAMLEACFEVKLPMKYAKQVLRSKIDDERAWAAMDAAIRWCERVDIPRGRIMKLAGENSGLVFECFKHRRLAHLPAYDTPGLKAERAIEPPELVYKKCLNDVIVVATIPPYANISKGAHGGYRSNSAKIVEVIGDFLGDEVGISLYDLKTQYRAGDKVYIQDFDYSNEEAVQGFHFFCTRDEAEKRFIL